MKFGVCSVFFLALGALSTGSATATDVYGGGASLPAGAYVGYDFLSGNYRQSSNTLTSTSGAAWVSPGSMFGAWSAATGNRISYCQTGSANGTIIFNHFDGVNVVAGATGVCNGTASGFNAPPGISVDPHFAVSDAPMSQTDYMRFANGGKLAQYGEPVQFPSLASAIGIVFNNPNAPVPFNLTDSQLCGIFSGSITYWNQLGVPDNGIPKPIKLVYRADGSGSTLSLMNHLAAACQSTATASQHFIVDQSFLFATRLLPVNPQGFGFGVTGDSAIVTTVDRTDGAIGYAGAGTFKAMAARNMLTSAQYARVNGMDPFADFPNSIVLVNAEDRVLNGVNATTGRPLITALTPSGRAGCMLIVDPASYANVPTRYPIMSVSYVVANNTGNRADAAAVQSLVAFSYGARPGVTTVGSGTGYAFINAVPTPVGRVNMCINS